MVLTEKGKQARGKRAGVGRVPIRVVVHRVKVRRDVLCAEAPHVRVLWLLGRSDVAVEATALAVPQQPAHEARGRQEQRP